MNMEKQRSKLRKGDKAMLAAARMQILLEKNMAILNKENNRLFTRTDILKVLNECNDIIKKAKIPKKYLLAETLDESTNKD